MAGDAFDIFQTDAGYAAVTNPVQRQILELLRQGDRQLPELVERTGRSKPTLSSHHMKELLARELVEERAHPTDSRRKVYRLKGQKVGSSDLPIADLKQAVQQYVRMAPLGGELGVGVALGSIGAAGPGAPPGMLHAQARRLGESVSRRFRVQAPSELALRMASFLEAEGLARALRMDLEKGTLTMARLPALESVDGHAGVLLAGFVEGVAAAAGLPLAVTAEDVEDGVVLRMGTAE